MSPVEKGRLLIKYPTRSRPAQFKQTLEHYISLLADPDNTRFLFSFDTDDTSMDAEWLKPYLATLGVGYTDRWGKSRNKVDAINRDLEGYDYPWDILLLASDDMLPRVYGYDKLIREQFQANGPDRFLWINDGRQDRICTIACMDRAYYERDGFIYNPKYLSLYCDNEQQEVAKNRGRLITAPNWITNESFQWGGTIANDALYRRNNRHYLTDQRTFKARQRAGFP